MFCPPTQAACGWLWLPCLPWEPVWELPSNGRWTFSSFVSAQWRHERWSNWIAEQLVSAPHSALLPLAVWREGRPLPGIPMPCGWRRQSHWARLRTVCRSWPVSPRSLPCARARKLAGPLVPFLMPQPAGRRSRAARSIGNQPEPGFLATPDSRPVSQTPESR